MRVIYSAVCFLLLLANLAIAKNALPLIKDYESAPPDIKAWMKENPPTVKREDLEFIVATDKHVYLAGEPIKMTISVRNATDKMLSLDYALGFFGATYITIFKPDVNDSEKEPDETSQKITEERVMLTSWNDPGDRYKIQANGALSRNIILSNWYDLSYPAGRYTVSVVHHVKQNFRFVFNMKATVSFEIRRHPVDIDTMAANDMTLVLGRGKLLEVLCNEAESILSRMVEGNVAEIEKSPEFDRLKKIMEQLGYFRADLKDPDTLDLNRKMDIKDLRSFIQNLPRT